ncbi:MAG: dTMP kinase [Gemmatimonadetes bacterium]|nr:dTMP kinase [Gemmatimonadota bacterium]
MPGGKAGAFVVVEGPDGAGKSTLVERLAGRLRAEGLDPLVVREPGGTPLAEEARRLAFDPALGASPGAELFLVLAARADLVHRVIRPALGVGRFVLSDRFDLSTEAYQVAGRGLPRDEVFYANRIATGGLRPDLTIVLDIPLSVGRGRQVRAAKKQDRMEREGDALHERVREAFARANGDGLFHLDADRPAEEVESDAWALLRTRFGETFPRRTG